MAYRSDSREILSNHFHNGYEIIFIEEGSSEFIINGVAGRYSKNCIIFLNHLEQHKMRPISDRYIRYVIILDPDCFDRFVGDQVLCSIFKQRPEGFENAFILPEEDAEFALATMKQCAEEYSNGEKYTELSICSRLLSLLIRLYRRHPERFPTAASSHIAATATKIQNYIDSNFLDDISLDFLAGEFHINKFYLLELFKKVTGYTVKQYVVLNRISHAKKLLYYSDKEISQIAMDSGFNSASNFIRAFRRHEGVTPLQFRKLY